jgi:hypothetical protein
MMPMKIPSCTPTDNLRFIPQGVPAGLAVIGEYLVIQVREDHIHSVTLPLKSTLLANEMECGERVDRNQLHQITSAHAL